MGDGLVYEAPDAAAVDMACARSATHHDRLCPRQVLGVRMGLAAREALGLADELPRGRLLVFVETDGCFVDGVEAATGCSIGHRTLRLQDYGRVAITAVDTETHRAVRIAPRATVRDRAAAFAGDETRRYYQQMDGYRVMPTAELLVVTPVALTFDLDALLGRPGIRVACERCGEEVLNGREQLVDGVPLCAACRAPAYYAPLGE